ncbi:MAG: sugar transferase [Lachnospiraceae bacterium]|nr:sugar transferase [Lachnospiraceae bacterium]
MGSNHVQTKDQWAKNLDFFLIDFAFTMGAYYLACLLRLHQIGAGFDAIYRDMGIALIPLIFFAQLATNPHIDIRKRTLSTEFYKSLEYISVVTLFLLLLQYFMQVGGDFSRGAFVYFWLFGTFIIFFTRIIYKKILNKFASARSRRTKVILVIDGDNPERKIEYFKEHGKDQYNITAVAVLYDEPEKENANPSNLLMDDSMQVFTGIDALYSFAENNSACEVLISISDSDTEKKIVREMLMMGITSHVNLDRAYEGMPNMHVETLADQLVITSSIQPFSPFQRFVKRLGDILGSIIGLVITFIFLIFIGPIIKLQSPGPVFFSQIRVGKNGKKFKMYKFRSMYADAEKRKAELMEKNEMNGPLFKMTDDPRITPIGRFIRKFSIDELPQFFNVLKGDMSLVGTRPPTVDEWDEYSAHHKARLSIKPGITGLWQVSGRNDIANFEEVVSLDLKYIQEWSVFEDIRIILRTIGVVVRAKGM